MITDDRDEAVRAIAATASPLTREQAEKAARILATVDTTEKEKKSA